MTVSPTVATRPPSTDGSTTDLQVDVLAGGVGERGLQPVLLVGGQLDGRADLGDLEVLASWRPARPAVDDRRQVAAATGADDHRDQLDGGRRRLAAEQVLDDGLALGRRDLLVGQRVAQLVARLERAGEAEQLVLDLVEGALGPGDLEQARGVPVDPIVGLGRSSLRPLAVRLAPTPWDEVLDQALLGLVVERLARRPGRPPPTARRAISARSSSPPRLGDGGDVGVGLGVELGDLGVEPGPPVASSASAWSSASASRRARSALDVARGLADLGRLGLGARSARRRRRRARPGSARCGRACAFLSERAGLPEQQAEDDDRGEAAEADLVALGPDPASGSGRCAPRRRRAGRHDALMIGPPRSSTSATALRARRPRQGARPVLSSTIRRRRRPTAASTLPRAASRAASASRRGGERRSAIACVGLGEPVGALALEHPGGRRRCGRRPRPARRPAPPRTRRPRARRRVADRLGRLELGADLAVAGLHPLLHLRDQAQPHQRRGTRGTRRTPQSSSLTSGAIGLGPSSSSSLDRLGRRAARRRRARRRRGRAPEVARTVDR